MDKKEILDAEITRIEAEISNLWSKWTDTNRNIDELTVKKNRIEAHIKNLRGKRDELVESLGYGTLYGIQQDTRWRGEIGDVYYSIYYPDNGEGSYVFESYEDGEPIDDINWNKGYYFRTREEALKALEKFNQ